ncbi:reactive intermediate imine deaminase A homolog UK114 [Tachypleus tridentatus]|uniref:reactive intermediate imine deaminase A homolog UK114 n=1 Tax=Tachypleus tridentatus TaxID=6853 RepID=UPI003FD4D57A
MASIIRKIINTSHAPKAIGPYSQAVQVGNTLYISGQIGFNPETMKLVEGGTVPQAKQLLQNMGKILEAAGATYNNVVKTTVLLTDMNDFSAVNEVYKEFFNTAFPARAAYQVVCLPAGAKVEIEAIAVVGNIVESQ